MKGLPIEGRVGRRITVGQDGNRNRHEYRPTLCYMVMLLGYKETAIRSRSHLVDVRPGPIIRAIRRGYPIPRKAGSMEVEDDMHVQVRKRYEYWVRGHADRNITVRRKYHGQ